MALKRVKSVLGKFTHKVYICEICGKELRVPANQKPKCPHCGRHKFRPKRRAL